MYARTIVARRKSRLNVAPVIARVSRDGRDEIEARSVRLSSFINFEDDTSPRVDISREFATDDIRRTNNTESRLMNGLRADDRYTNQFGHDEISSRSVRFLRTPRRLCPPLPVTANNKIF